MHYLSVIAIFKNESHSIGEWINHYKNEGVDHFYLIDNGSTDDYLKKIQFFINEGTITLIKDDTKWAQIELYNKHFLAKKTESRWFLICDLDEFVYARGKYLKITDFLKSLSKKVGAVRIPWKVFGSSGYVSQPDRIIPSFTQRCLYDNLSNPGMKDKSESLSKVIVRSSSLRRFDVHYCDVKKKHQIIDPAKNTIDPLVNHEDIVYQETNEQLLSAFYLHLNHYAIQSLQWFMEVKSTRGAADTKEHDNVRNEAYFHNYDENANAIADSELADKSYPSPQKRWFHFNFRK